MLSNSGGSLSPTSSTGLSPARQVACMSVLPGNPGKNVTFTFGQGQPDPARVRVAERSGACLRGTSVLHGHDARIPFGDHPLKLERYRED